MHICYNIGTHLGNIFILGNRFCRNICSGVHILGSKVCVTDPEGTEQGEALVRLLHSLVQRFNVLSCEESRQQKVELQ